MLCLDVNVLMNTFNPMAPDNEKYVEKMGEWATRSETVAIPDVVASGFLRLATNPRVFEQPATPAEAWVEVDRLTASAPFQLITPGPRHWIAFRRLAEQFGAIANDVPDAFIAAYAVENNATLISDDRGFSRFDGLRWRRPLDA
jgi:toxin-antitoxin system PIN domain toxin